MTTWIDRHSINCCICDKIIDEREAMRIEGGGEFCASHQNWILPKIHSLCSTLRMKGYSYYFEQDLGEILNFGGDTIELPTALSQLHKESHIAFYSIAWHRSAHQLYNEITTLIGV